MRPRPPIAAESRRASCAELVRSLRDCLAKLVAEPDQARAMGQRAQDYTYRNFTWDAKAQQVLEVYRWALQQHPDKPDFGMPVR
ncbi:MAG: hypothetical protein NTY01_21850 [Verrucomicrobia bacterium]|nr:hypothetical protein [Verrucomicrobiota bacterium]